MADDIGILQWGLGLLGTAFLGVSATFGKVIGDERKTREDAEQKIWDRIDQVSKNANDGRVETAKTYATKDDFHRLQEHIDNRMDEHEKRMTQLIVGSRFGN